MKRLDGSAERRIEAPAERCVRAAADLQRWPEWVSTVRSVAPADTGMLVQAGVLGIPLVVVLAVDAARERVALRRLPFGDDDEERFELLLTAVDAGADACRASVAIEAELDVPRLLPVPGAIADRVAGRLLADLEKRVATAP